MDPHPQARTALPSPPASLVVSGVRPGTHRRAKRAARPRTGQPAGPPARRSLGGVQNPAPAADDGLTAACAQQGTALGTDPEPSGPPRPEALLPAGEPQLPVCGLARWRLAPVPVAAPQPRLPPLLRDPPHRQPRGTQPCWDGRREQAKRASPKSLRFHPPLPTQQGACCGERHPRACASIPLTTSVASLLRGAA